MRIKILVLAIAAWCVSCSTLESTTFIDPGKSFELGKNEHAAFSVNVENKGKSPIEIYHAPIDGGKHSSEMVAVGGKTKIKVDPNTALIFKNANPDTATVSLRVHGDLGLSMQYAK